MRLVGLIFAIGCFFAAPLLYAERVNHGWDQDNHAHMTHQGGRHYGQYRSGGHDGITATTSMRTARLRWLTRRHGHRASRCSCRCG